MGNRLPWVNGRRLDHERRLSPPQRTNGTVELFFAKPTDADQKALPFTVRITGNQPTLPLQHAQSALSPNLPQTRTAP